MKTNEYYERLFSSYPDVVTLPEFREMLGGIGDTTARKLMRANLVQHYYIRDTYLIPKPSVIAYVLSEHYAQLVKQLKYRYECELRINIKPAVLIGSGGLN